MKKFLLTMSIAVAVFGAGATYAQNDQEHTTSVIAQVTGVSLKDTFKKKIILQWTAVDDVSGYQIYLMNKHKKKLRTLYSNTTKKTIKKLKPGKRYKLKVRGIIDDKQEGEWSEILSFVTDEDDTNDQDATDDSGDELDITTESIAIEDFAFTPASLTIAAGSTVTWTNNDSSTHTVTSTDGGDLNSGNLAQGDTYEFTFDTPGTYTYRCNIHTSMTGTVIVE
ncbi:MAG: cupredoxin domain-containing protein [Candidatus Kerfeldbacteria bacterium]|nr:cupredoxin domain-containing protein [Candidatus Kerfeldbacteria bacterium]